MKEYDIVIIGAGAGGLTAAYTAKGFGKKVALIERNNPGGECTWSGCVPSKALINIAKDVYIAKKYADIEVDTSEVLEKVRRVIKNVYEGENPQVLEKDGIDFIKGFAKFIDKNKLDVNGNIIKGKKIIISTGSSPFIPPIKGLDKVNFLTNENIFTQEKLPENIIVLGAGAIGVELSQALNRLGIRVSLVEMMDSVLFREEDELAKLLEERLINEGVNIYTSTKAVNVNEVNNKIILEVERNDNIDTLEGDSILLALGRTPNINNLNLEEVEVKFNKRGIEVNEYLETNVKNIYAVGDVVGPYQFSHMANMQGITAVQNAVLPINKKIDYSHVAWCTFSEPELARAGLTEKEARDKYKDDIRVYTETYKNLDRAKTKEDDLGIVKIICDKKGKILGASVLGNRAGEIISEIQTIKTLGINFAKLSKVIHPYPTYSEILVKISKKVYIDNILNNPFIKLINGFRK
ncbi:MAG: NAD(P)/FAD-dependent oxidoreductase [Tepidibacter sp.]|jgi:pyruvate/2-oxoglutarate dehydrogenase complex dihydrolipoamide dehydrogenase (E3) component|uniref:dihydrolipoyl dehydrogenase family protein n=1 Tax=Tepidibacter sp. TaxID=2529387 RepID=UPI0025EB7580|nr:NAD(P)/FAD-dependent oxidoreductase [Tepidibacter sp.]MCT4507293.1 NAD(P)/FAD-dependent oxidoreductase [Tepidibacter sp.]